MDPVRLRVRLVHAMPGRARLRCEWIGEDRPQLRQVERALREHPAVTDVLANAQTGSILITYDGELAPILEDAQTRGLLELHRSSKRLSMRGLQQVIERIDARVARETGQALSLGDLTFVALVGAGLWQVAKGRALPAGTTLFNYAFELMEWMAEREPPLPEEDPSLS